MSDQVTNHYERLADEYNENWEHSPEFIRWMTGCIINRLEPRSGDRVADIGCGTGLFASGLVERAGRVTCVDPSEAMLRQLPKEQGYEPVQGTAEDLVAGNVTLPEKEFDAILVKEAIHHVQDHARVLTGLANLLAPGGRVLVVMLPTSIDYPLFARALREFEKHQPDPREIADHLERSGLRTDLGYEDFSLAFSKERYFRMVRNRYMSLLSAFSDEELEEGITEIDQHHPEETLRFSDRFAFITGRRV